MGAPGSRSRRTSRRSARRAWRRVRRRRSPRPGSSSAPRTPPLGSAPAQPHSHNRSEVRPHSICRTRTLFSLGFGKSSRCGARSRGSGSVCARGVAWPYDGEVGIGPRHQDVIDLVLAPLRRLARHRRLVVDLRQERETLLRQLRPTRTPPRSLSHRAPLKLLAGQPALAHLRLRDTELLLDLSSCGADGAERSVHLAVDDGVEEGGAVVEGVGAAGVGPVQREEDLLGRALLQQQFCSATRPALSRRPAKYDRAGALPGAGRAYRSAG